MPQCLDVPVWRVATGDEVVAFTKALMDDKPKTGSILNIRSKLSQVDVYAWLRARFGLPNGFQNFLRKDDSDNLIHWDFNLKAGPVDVYIQGRSRDVVVTVHESMTDEDWKALIIGIRNDFGRVGSSKSEIMRSFEKFVVFQNKYVTLANLCADLHASIVDTPEAVRSLPRIRPDGGVEDYKAVMAQVTQRATNLYGDCLKLKLLTPIMAEAFLNMIILTFCKESIRTDKDKYEGFIREKIPERLALLATNCVGFARGIDLSSEGYRGFLRVMNARNYLMHGNMDPVREAIETVYFEGKRPLFVENGDHIFKLFEHLEEINVPEDVLQDYEGVHQFLVEIQDLLEPRYRAFFDAVLDDPYPGYEVNVRRVTKILPSHNAAILLPDEKYDDDLNVKW